MMNKFKTLRTQFENDYGLIQFNDSGEVYLATSSTPSLFGIESTEESLAEYFSKFRIEGEDRNFDWKKDLPEDWELVEVEIKIVETKTKEESWVEKWIKNMEEWEELSPSEAAIVKSIIRIEKIKPFDVSNSFHVSESRYKIDDDIIRFIGAIGEDNSGDIIEKLKKK